MKRKKKYKKKSTHTFFLAIISGTGVFYLFSNIYQWNSLVGNLSNSNKKKYVYIKDLAVG